MKHKNIMETSKNIQKTSQSRLDFIDFYRGLAILAMIATHVLDSFLSEKYHHQFIYQTLFSYTGYVAVAFCFCAGASLVFAFNKKSLSSLMRRSLFILFCGYWQNGMLSHYPSLLHGTQQEILHFWSTDILQVIAVSIMFSACIWKILAARYRLIFFTLFSLIIFYSSPFIWQLHLEEKINPILGLYFANMYSTKFCFFPYFGYFCAGLVVMMLYENALNKKQFAVNVLSFSILLFQIVFIIHDHFSFRYPGWNLSWYASPGHSLWRLSGVLFVFSLCILAENFLQRFKTFSSFLKESGKESLSIYIIHNLIIYQSSFFVGLQGVFYKSKGYAFLFFSWILISLICFALAMMWKNFKTRYQRLIIPSLLLFFTIYLFFIFYELWKTSSTSFIHYLL